MVSEHSITFLINYYYFSNEEKNLFLSRLNHKNIGKIIFLQGRDTHKILYLYT